MKNFKTILYENIDDIFDYAVNIRRDIHSHPETGWLEVRTSNLIANELKKMGCDRVLTGDDVTDPASRHSIPSYKEFEEHMELISNDIIDSSSLPLDPYCSTGVIGILDCGEGPTIAVRCDIDALPIEEAADSSHLPFKEGFASEYEGIMHACGHDGHTAILLGIAKFMSSNKEIFRGIYKFIFQPSEEGARGAASIVARGHLDDVDLLFGMHMCNKEPDDPDIVIESNRTLATTKLNASFTGKEAHAANSPENGHNALLAACTAVQNLYAISRHSQSDTRINVGSLHAGEARNIICPYSELKLEVRGTTTLGNEYMLKRAEEILNAAALMHNCTCHTEIAGHALSIPNDPYLSQNVDACINEAGISCKYMPERNWSASEDFSLMAERVNSNGGRSCYIRLISDTKAPLHDNKFDFDEISIRNGMIGIIYTLLKM